MAENIVDYDLPVSFYFKVIFVGISDSLAFKEASGFSVEMEVESHAEGGLNEYEHKLPKQIKHTNLVLKRALLKKDNPIESWIIETLENDFSIPIKKKDISVYLLDPEGKPMMGWTCNKAFPVKWDISGFDSGKNEVMIESIEFAYADLKRIL